MNGRSLPKLSLFLILFSLPFLTAARSTAADVLVGTPVFINEIHYDNTSADANEGVEVAGPAGTDLTGWSLVPYNGNGGTQYSVTALSGTIGDLQNGFGASFFAIVGLQNGAPDGIALVDASNTVIQFLCYEGTFAATDGPASGMSCADIGVSEDGAGPVGDSLQITGTGQFYEDFSWSGTQASTYNAINTGQTFTGTPSVSDPVLNEFVANHTGTDTNEYVEIYGDPNTDYSSFYILEIEGDSTGGAIDRVFQVGTTDANGLWVTAYQSSIENGSVTFLLVKDFTGIVTNDVDTNDDGVIDTTYWSALVDDVSVSDGGASDKWYSATILDSTLLPSAGFTPGGASRIPDGTDTDTAADWVRNDFDGYGLPGFTGTPDPGDAVNTPGASNEVVPAAVADPVINEFVANHTGTDTNEYIEIYGDPNTDYSSFYILEIEGDSTGGVIDRVFQAGTTDANGLWVTAYQSSIENGSVTFLLVKDFTGIVTNDIDTNDDGVIDTTYWSALVDDVSISDGGASDKWYSATILDSTLTPESGFAPGGASRIPDGTDTDTAADWVRNDFDGYGLPGFTGTPSDGVGVNTPGAPNEVFTPVVTTCSGSPTLISAVQGSGLSSPLDGLALEVAGIVVGDYQGSSGLNGFFIQEEDTDTDADPLTSEGIFVFDSGFGTDVAVGDLVQVGGTVDEFFELTELTSVTCVSVLSSGNAMPSVSALSLPVTTLDDLEPFEGMLVTINQELTVTETFTLGRFGEVSLSVGGRLFNPTNVVDPGQPAIDLQDLNDRSRIQLDDGSNVQNPLPLPPYLGPDNTLRSGDTLPSLTGVLGFAFGVYEIHPIGPITFTHTNARTTEPDDVGGSLKIASFNVLNYFTTIDTGADICGPLANQECRGADSAAELTRQTDKIVNALLAIDADVVGLIEIENDAANAAVAGLVSALNAAAGAFAYDYIATGPIGSDAIRLAFIYKPASVTPAGGFEILDSSDDPTFLDFLNRPALAQTFEENSSGERFTVAVNHLKSKGSDCNGVGDPDTGDGQGNCNLTRLAAAIALANWLATDPTGSGDPDFLIIGDLNSYAMEDPIVALEDAGYTDLLEAFVGSGAYSYVFSGQSGYLDHALANPALLSQISGATAWHINADEPIALDYNTEFNQPLLYTDEPYRSSDHDAIVVGLALAAAPDLQLTKSDGGITATNGQVISYTLAYTNTGTTGASGVVITETVPTGTSFSAVDSSPGWSCPHQSPQGTQCVLSVGAFGSGQSSSSIFAVFVGLNSPVTTVNNSAVIGDDGANGPDGNPADNTGSDSTAVVDPIVHIDSLEMVEVDHPTNFLVKVTFRVVNQFGFGVASATFQGEVTEHPAGMTGLFSTRTRVGGYVTRMLRARTPGTFGVCAVNVTGPGVVYDPDSNVVTCGSLEVSGPVTPIWASGLLSIATRHPRD